MNKKSNKENKTKEMFDKIVDGVTEIINSGEYERFLRFRKYFSNYSFKNMVLIFSQMPEATQVAGFKKWQSMGRRLKKGVKGIQIIYPIKRTYKTEIEGQDSLIKGEPKEQTIEYLIYRPTYVYDISQTVGKPMPLEDNRLNSGNMKELYEFLKSFSPYTIIENNLSGGTKGYWSPKNKQIFLRKELSIDDKVSVLLHELIHALYDDFNYEKDRNLSETFVETIAFIVADHFGLDTSMCSFNYVAAWTGDVKIILELGDKIQKTANQFIKQIEEYQEQNLKIIA